MDTDSVPKHPLQEPRRVYRVKLGFSDPTSQLAVAFTVSPKYNPKKLESYWYSVYKSHFKPLESLESYTSILAPQFTVSRVIREDIEDVVYIPRQSEAPTRRIPTFMQTRDPETGEITLHEVEDLPVSPPASAQEFSTKEYREWRIPDFSLLVSRYYGKEIVLTGKTKNVQVEITSPVSLEKEATVPVIIEIKRRRSDDPSVNIQTLMKTDQQLLQQAEFLFSDFERLQEVIAIAGVGLYWWWFKIPRPPRGQDPGDDYVFAGHPSSDSGDSSDVDTNHPPTRVYHNPRIPFVIGTKESTKEVLRVKAAVQEMVKRSLKVVRMAQDTGEQSEDNVADYYKFLRTISKAMIQTKGEGEEDVDMD